MSHLFWIRSFSKAPRWALHWQAIRGPSMPSASSIRGDPMSDLPPRLFTRRAWLGAAAFAGTATWAHRVSGRHAAKPVVEGDCEDEPAVEMLFDWRSGRPVYQSV